MGYEHYKGYKFRIWGNGISGHEEVCYANSAYEAEKVLKSKYPPGISISSAGSLPSQYEINQKREQEERDRERKRVEEERARERKRVEEERARERAKEIKILNETTYKERAERIKLEIQQIENKKVTWNEKKSALEIKLNEILEQVRSDIKNLNESAEPLIKEISTFNEKIQQHNKLADISETNKVSKVDSLITKLNTKIDFTKDSNEPSTYSVLLTLGIIGYILYQYKTEIFTFFKALFDQIMSFF